MSAIADLDRACPMPRRNVRLDTLVRLRWLSVIGQTTAVLVVYLGLDFELPIWACLAVIALSAWLEYRAAASASSRRSGWSRARRLAARVRHRRAGGAAVPDRRSRRIRSRSCFSAPVLMSATALPRAHDDRCSAASRSPAPPLLVFLH